jgi:LacI family transcriptional regulator
MAIKKRPRIALDIETSRVYGRRILMGISRYMFAHAKWSIYIEQHEIGGDLCELLSRWKGEGIISRQINPAAVKQLRKRKLAAVDLSNFFPHMGVPRINSADFEIGRMAAKHFIERGFQDFGCCGYIDQHWSQQRANGFADEVRYARGTCVDFEQPFRTHAHSWDEDQNRLASWLSNLPKPVGVLATNDLLGHHVLDACTRAGLLVPEQVAVLGVDNDELLCGLCNPQLSSVIPDPEQIGYEAAGWLDRIMRGEKPERDAILEIPPLGIAVRQSTDIYAVSDPDIARALQFIREHACDGISVQDVVNHISASRSWLERGFRVHLGRSPQAEIRRTQIDRCKELLKTTDLTLDRIASMAGFRHCEYMSALFKKEIGESPGRFRRQIHLHQ